jgi:hypothetical protein
MFSPDHRMFSPDHFHPTRRNTMQPIEFTGIRGGHGATTVALAAAATLATRGPTRIATHDRKALCATVGIAPDGLPLPLTDNLELAGPTEQADVIDAGTLNHTRCRRGHSQGGPEPLRIGVLRGPDYLGLRTLCEHTGAPLGGLVVISEAGRALDARDVEQVSGYPVVAVVDHTPSVARIIDAGVFMHRHQRLREFTQLRYWLTPTTRTQETPCTPAD